jgi:hypothetical protein
MTEGTPISYLAVEKGLPVATRDGHTFATVEHVLQIPAEDLFDGVVVKTEHGIRFVDRDQILTITDTLITCDLDDAQAAALPAPDGSPVYSVDALQDDGRSLHDVLGRLFRRPRWKLDD